MLTAIHARLALIFLALVGVCPAGELNQRFDLTLQRVLTGGPPTYDPPFLLADLIPRDVRRFTNFSGDLSGRYIGALAAASKHRAVPTEDLRRLVREALEQQREDGHFGAPLSTGGVEDDDMARMWGNGRLLIGLLEYYALSKDDSALHAARGMGDFLISSEDRFGDSKVREEFSVGRLAHGYICWTQNIEGLVELGRVTGEARYTELAAAMAEDVSRQPAQHSHGLLSSLRGILALYRATGDKQWLGRVEAVWSELAASKNVLVSGTVAEYLEPSIRRDEGCSVADWLRLSLELWQITRKPRHIDAAERAWFNGFAMNQFPSGDFGHVYFSENGFERGGDRAWWCCTLHGLRAFSAVADAAFQWEEDRLLYELAVDSTFDDGLLKVRAGTQLDVDSSALLEIEAAPAEPVVIGVRGPAWVNDLTLSLNGQTIEPTWQNGYALVRRSWSTGDRLWVKYELRTKTLRDRSRPGRRALLVGPWLMAVAEATTPTFFDEVFSQNETNTDEPAEVPGEPARRDVSYVPSGYREQVQTARLRPVGERTWSGRQGRWEVWLRREGEVSAAEKAVARLPEPEQAPILLIVVIGAIAVNFYFLWRRRQH